MHKRQFLSTLKDCRALFHHCLNPRGEHSDSGIEASFLQLFKGWESFLEDCTLSYMCGRLRCDGTSLKSYSVSMAEEWARKVLYQERHYVEWTQVDKVIERWDALFLSPNPLSSSLRSAKAHLEYMKDVRNVIAHSSPKSQENFNSRIRSTFGGNRRLHRAAPFLSDRMPSDQSNTFFDYYADILETLAGKVAG